MSVITDRSLAQIVEEISGQRHAMAGAVIAASAAQASALGQACVRISRDEESLHKGVTEKEVSRLNTIKNELLDWCDWDAAAIADFVAGRETEPLLERQRSLCRAPATITDLAIETAIILQNFRPLVSERVRDDMEMSISLLAGTAQAALLLLDSNLRIWPDQVLTAEFEPILAGLTAKINTLSPVKRVRET